MSKPITTAELHSAINDALKPLFDAIKRTNITQETTNAQMGEVFQVVTSIGVKMDLLDQNTHAVTMLHEEQASVKKLPAKKGVKKTAKKTELDAETDPDADADPDAETETIEPEEKAPVKKGTKKTPVKKGTKLPVKKVPIDVDAVDAADADADVDAEGDATDNANTNTNTNANTSANTSAKPPAKKVTKKTTKKGTKAAAPVKRKNPPNKMEFFNKMYDEDETYFDAYLTPKIKKELIAANTELFEDLESDALKKAKRSLFYHYMKDNLDDKLQSLKKAYLEETNTAKIDLATKEGSESE